MKLKSIILSFFVAISFISYAKAYGGELSIEAEVDQIEVFDEAIDLDGDDKLEQIEIIKTPGSSGLLQINIGGFSKEFYKGIYGIDEGGFWVAYPIYEDEIFTNAFYDRLERVYIRKNGGKIEVSRPEEYEETEYIQKSSSNDKYYENPSASIIERKLERAAKNRGIPSVILKSIAYAESNWLQFRNGKPVISFDGGYGIMQVTPSQSQIDSGYYDVERLKYDIDYNIEKGADILLGKWGYALGWKPVIPKIAENDPNILESWYFTIWAYNGWSRVNNPNDEDAWTKPYAYQDRVIYFAETRFGTLITPIDRLELPKSGLPSSSRVFELPDDIHYGDLDEYSFGDVLICRTGLNLRDKEDGWAKIGVVATGEPMYVLEGPYLQNGYDRYRVMFYENKEQIEGWIAINWGDIIESESINKDSYELVEFDTKKVSEDKVWTIDFNQRPNVDKLLDRVKIARLSQDGDVEDFLGIVPRVDENSKSIHLEHDRDFESGNKYAIFIDSDIEDEDGRDLRRNMRFEFEVE